jgi:hypothetical protein
LLEKAGAPRPPPRPMPPTPPQQQRTRAVQDASSLDGECQRRGQVGLKRICRVRLERHRPAVRRVLPLDARLQRHHARHVHVRPERPALEVRAGRAGDRALGAVLQVHLQAAQAAAHGGGGGCVWGCGGGGGGGGGWAGGYCLWCRTAAASGCVSEWTATGAAWSKAGSCRGQRRRAAGGRPSICMQPAALRPGAPCRRAGSPAAAASRSR